ncbi:hypothetical protein Asp14428_16270 [Actinoplanes sp. NBRC 14428]|uniref:Uncharacterized protein n=1 Tax=Pseudosporangium ferrugineum TaxID=439699 RepID=A0A2T0SB12_9ACTN|nr:hypothetical protein [Pseudosporangium ferrugineum]PRY30610.1 hypothetical protein CLV70_104162 [Pseudosporangium ferrugineum]BCJ50152.1 hypothetical protein Asp14428_16270 [Actinoplanes sp. NBRC 14428]
MGQVIFVALIVTAFLGAGYLAWRTRAVPPPPPTGDLSHDSRMDGGAAPGG